MSPIAGAWRDLVEAARAFSRPARRLLAAEFMLWTGHGVGQVVFNLYLVAAGFTHAEVGQAISAQALAMAAGALPAGVFARRFGRGRTILFGIAIDAAGQILRCAWTGMPFVLGGSVLVGAGQSLMQIAAAPFLTEHSTARERTHLFSTFFAVSLLAAVAGNLVGGWLPAALLGLPSNVHPGTTTAYRVALVLGALVTASGLRAMWPLRGREPADPAPLEDTHRREARARLVPIGVNALLIGAGAGLVIPFMNLYFAERFGCSSGTIGSLFSIAQIGTALASLVGPAVARRFGKLRAAVSAQLLSLPFLVTLGAERHLEIAVVAFWMRATLMQASSPLLQTFVMEAMPAHLRATATSLTNLLWNVGWALSATLAGAMIQRFGYATPFYATAALYAIAATSFYVAFRGTPEGDARPKLTEEAKGHHGEP